MLRRTPAPDVRALSAADVERLTRRLARAVLASGPRPDRLVIVARGGLVVGGLLAALLPRARRAVLLVKGPLAPGSPRAPGRVLPAALRDLPGGGPVLAAATVPAARWVLFPWSPPAERRG